MANNLSRANAGGPPLFPIRMPWVARIAQFLRWLCTHFSMSAVPPAIQQKQATRFWSTPVRWVVVGNVVAAALGGQFFLTPEGGRAYGMGPAMWLFGVAAATFVAVLATALPRQAGRGFCWRVSVIGLSCLPLPLGLLLMQLAAHVRHIQLMP